MCGTDELPEFTFLNTTAKPEGWNDEFLELLWRYNLHYFDYINARVEGSRINDRVEVEKGRKLGDLMERWINENPRGSFPGWDPYPTSLRIVNWVKWLNGSHVERVESSLKEQTDWLMNHILN